MGSGKLKKIFKGKFPKETPSLDDQVKMVTSAGELLKERVAEGKSIDEKANNLFLWLGGVNKDVQLYACKHLFNYRGLEFEADEKTEARLAYLEPFFKYDRADGYKADTFQSIDHRPWPVEYLDGTTFEDRLDSLAEEVKPENIGTADMILNGIEVPSLEDSQVFGLLHEISDALKALYDKGQSQRMIFQEKVDNALGWVLTQPPEYGVYFGRLLLTKDRVVIGVEGTKNVEPFISQYEALIIG